MKGGEYQTWKAASDHEDGKRIDEVADNDEEKTAIDEEADAPKKAALIKITLLKRNAQLAKIIQHLVGFVFYTEADDIDILSTSIEWVFQYLRAHYNIESKDTNFLKITDHICKSDMQPQVIYKTFRTSF